MNRFIEVYLSWNLAEIICVRSFLDSRGIASLLLNEHHITQSSGALASALGGYRVMVAESEVNAAKRLLNEADAENLSLGEDFDESDVSRW